MTLIGDNHLPVERVLEVVVPDIVPGQPHNLTQMGDSLYTDDCPQVLVGLQLSSQDPVASVAARRLLERRKLERHLLERRRSN
jgi:hypothetical protein